MEGSPQLTPRGAPTLESLATLSQGGLTRVPRRGCLGTRVQGSGRVFDTELEGGSLRRASFLSTTFTEGAHLDRARERHSCVNFDSRRRWSRYLTDFGGYRCIVQTVRWGKVLVLLGLADAASVGATCRGLRRADVLATLLRAQDMFPVQYDEPRLQTAPAGSARANGDATRARLG